MAVGGKGQTPGGGGLSEAGKPRYITLLWELSWIELPLSSPWPGTYFPANRRSPSELSESESSLATAEVSLVCMSEGSWKERGWSHRVGHCDLLQRGQLTVDIFGAAKFSVLQRRS